MTRGELRLLADYLRATENEIAIDTSLYEMLGLQPSQGGYLPRPGKSLSRLAPWQKRLLPGVSLLRFFWRFGGGAIFLFIECLRFIGLASTNNKKPSPFLSADDTYGVLFSERAAGVINQAIPNNSLVWVIFPWVINDSIKSSGRTLDILTLLSLSDLMRAWSLSVKAVHCLGRHARTKHWVLQGYTALRWMATRIAFDKVDAKGYVIAEHYDRWACLIDSAVRSRSRKAFTSSPGFTIVQHGSLASLNNSQSSKAELPLALYSRHLSVSSILVYDIYSRDVFFNSVISHSCQSRGVRVDYYRPTIILSELYVQKGFSILFVGHSLCEQLHIDLHRSLGSVSIFSFYKPHPTSPPSNEVVNQSWLLIQGREIFPPVDLLISYPSTLVDEYASLGVPAVLHSLNESEVDRSMLLQQILSTINSLMREKNDIAN